jgi:hypothetical protein
VLRKPASDAVFHDASHAGELRHHRDDDGREHSGDHDDQETGAHGPGAGVGQCDRRERRERRVVEHAENDEAQPDRAESGARSRKAPHAGDANRVVDAARHRDASDARRAACERKRARGRPVVWREEALPTPRLERIRNEKENRRGSDKDRIRVVQRPAALDEVLHAEVGNCEKPEAQAPVQEELHLLIAE